MATEYAIRYTTEKVGGYLDVEVRELGSGRYVKRGLARELEAVGRWQDKQFIPRDAVVIARTVSPWKPIAIDGGK